MCVQTGGGGGSQTGECSEQLAFHLQLMQVRRVGAGEELKSAGKRQKEGRGAVDVCSAMWV